MTRDGSLPNGLESGLDQRDTPLASSARSSTLANALQLVDRACQVTRLDERGQVKFNWSTIEVDMARERTKSPSGSTHSHDRKRHRSDRSRSPSRRTSSTKYDDRSSRSHRDSRDIEREDYDRERRHRYRDDDRDRERSSRRHDSDRRRSRSPTRRRDGDEERRHRHRGAYRSLPLAGALFPIQLAQTIHLPTRHEEEIEMKGQGVVSALATVHIGNKPPIHLEAVISKTRRRPMAPLLPWLTLLKCVRRSLFPGIR